MSDGLPEQSLVFLLALSQLISVRRCAPATALFGLHWRKLRGADFMRNEFAGSGADLQRSKDFCGELRSYLLITELSVRTATSMKPGCFINIRTS